MKFTLEKSDFKTLKKILQTLEMLQVDLRQKNAQETSKIPLQYFAYGFGAIEPMIFNTQSDFLEKIKKWGFSINPLTKQLKI